MLTGLFSELFNGIWMIDRNYAESYLPLIANLIKGNIKQEDFSEERKKSLPRYITFENGIHVISDYGSYGNPDKAPKNSIALISMHGPVTYYDQYCGPSGMATKSELLARCADNPNIKAVILELRSGGGEGYASGKYVRSIQDFKNKGKPIVAFVEDYAFSAAYEIAAACDWIIANTNAAKTGSIGTFVTIADYKKFWKKEGIRLIEIYAKKSKDKNKDYYEALKGNTGLIQSDVNHWNEIFLQEIAENRGDALRAEEDVWGTGKTFFADKALEIGLIDEISSFDKVVESLETSINSN